jgi:LEA14-like dessication related protein
MKCSLSAYFFLAVSVLALAAASGCGMMEKPTGRITGVKVQDVKLTEATMIFDVQVDNPYSVALPVSNMDYALSSQGQQFLSGKADVAGEIPASGSKVLPVPVRISFVELARVVKEARPGATIPYTADLGLSVNAPVWGPLHVPMTKEGQIEIPTTQTLLNRLGDLAK